MDSLWRRAFLRYLASIGKRGLQIEVGPTPQGVVRWDVVDATRRALDAILELAEREAAGETVELPARGRADGVFAIPAGPVTLPYA